MLPWQSSTTKVFKTYIVRACIYDIAYPTTTSYTFVGRNDWKRSDDNRKKNSEEIFAEASDDIVASQLRIAKYLSAGMIESVATTIGMNFLKKYYRGHR